MSFLLAQKRALPLKKESTAEKMFQLCSRREGKQAKSWLERRFVFFVAKQLESFDRKSLKFGWLDIANKSSKS